MYHRINTIADEERLLEEMLQLQSQIRSQREAERKTKTYNSGKYTKIFEPVTKSIEKLLPSVDVEPNEPIIIDELVDLKEPTKATPPDLIDFKEEEPEPEGPEPEGPGDLYKQALGEIPRKFRDDGMLGLNVETHQIGRYTYEVKGNTLHLSGDEQQKEQFEIDSLNLWKLLIVANPSKIHLQLKENGQYLPFVNEYIAIGKKIGLLDSYSGSTRRAKYQLLNHKGSGFLFSVQPPSVVLPSDRVGVLMELNKALAELRAGNDTMRNLVVPLAQEARRMNILPPDLLSPEEETWIFA